MLIACESSGVERDAFLAAGHDAVSCDLLPTERPGPHYQGDVLQLLSEPFDLVIAHPPCTYLAKVGVRWLHVDPERAERMATAAQFFARMFDFRTERLCVENPLQFGAAERAHGMGRPNAWVQPWQFGHYETKRTCLWLRGLPPLIPTNNVLDATMRLPESERQRTEYKRRGMSDRSRSFPGIARAMAEQWGTL